MKDESLLALVVEAAAVDFRALADACADGFLDNGERTALLNRAQVALDHLRSATERAPRLDWRARDLLTTREREVLERLVRGESTKTLCRDMGITYRTARAHIQHVLYKLGAHSKLEAVAFAVENELVPLPQGGERQGRVA